MAMLIVGGVTVPLAQSGDQSETPDVIGGGVVRMFDGSARTTKRAEKRNLSCSTVPMNASDSAALIAVLTSLGAVTCSGDLLGGSVSMVPQITNKKSVTMLGVLYRVIAFTLSEA